MTALKVIPWSDVIDATPGIVKGARRIFTRSQQTELPAPATSNADWAHRVAQLEASLAQAAEQQRASAQLIESLAEQNERIVQAIDILRIRTRLLIGACGVLALLLAALAVWAVR